MRVRPVFDGHNDVLLKLFARGGVEAADAFLSGLDGHLDLPRAQMGGLKGGFFAIFVPSPVDLAEMMSAMRREAYDLPLPEPISQAAAMPVALAQASILTRLEDLGAVKICRSVAEIDRCFEEGVLAAVMHMEGAEAIDIDLEALDIFYAVGLRSLGPVWSRPTVFGYGAPFRFPSDGDIGPGLTEAGVRLVKRCDELGVVVDLSHMNEAGFWDVARVSQNPLVATHSNAHAITPHARNLTDRQLDAIAERDGIVGLNFALPFLRSDGRSVDTGLDAALRHLDHMIERLGEDRVGLGSDFDGAEIPTAIGSVAGLPALTEAMTEHGYGESLIQKLAADNWKRVLRLVWGR